MKSSLFFSKLVLFFVILMLANETASGQNLVIESDTFYRLMTVEVTASRAKMLRVALPAINQKAAVHGFYLTLKFDQSGKTVNPNDTTCKIEYDQYAVRLYTRKDGPKYPKQAPIILPGEDCVEYVDRVIRIPEKWIESRCEVDTLDRTPQRKDSAYVVPQLYIATQFNVPNHSPKFEFGIGGGLTQFYLHKSSKSDSLASWMQRFFQVNIHAESSLAFDEVVEPYVFTCDSCEGIKKKKPQKTRIGSVNTISVMFEIRGKHELRPVNKTECRGYIGAKYYITEVEGGKTVNRGEDGFALVCGFAVFSPKNFLWILHGMEFNLQGVARPFLGWQTQAQLQFLIHF